MVAWGLGVGGGGPWTIHLGPGSRCEDSSSDWHSVCLLVDTHLGGMEGRSGTVNLVQDQNANRVLTERKHIATANDLHGKTKRRLINMVSLPNLRIRSTMFP